MKKEVVTKNIVKKLTVVKNFEMLIQEDECRDDCPIRATSELVEGKWTTLIFRDLYSGKKRYSELHRSLIGISPRMLALRLKTLEEKRMITRKVFETNPPTTEYELTDFGREFGHVLNAMAEFGLKIPK